MPRRTQASTPDEAVSQVKWESPPERKTYNWDRIAKRLQAKPGEWALIYHRGPTSIANAIRQNNIKAVRPVDGFEVTTSNNVRGVGQNRTCSLYLRYVPPKRKRKR